MIQRRGVGTTVIESFKINQACVNISHLLLCDIYKDKVYVPNVLLLKCFILISKKTV